MPGLILNTQSLPSFREALLFLENGLTNGVRYAMFHAKGFVGGRLNLWFLSHAKTQRGVSVGVLRFGFLAHAKSQRRKEERNKL